MSQPPEAVKEMFYNHTSKSGRGSSGYGQNRQSTILPLFVDSTDEDTVTPQRTLEETLYLLNPAIPFALVQDVLITHTFAYSEMTLRARWGLSAHADIRRAMQLRNRWLYHYFCLAEEGLRFELEALILNQSVISMEWVTQFAANVCNKYIGDARNVAKLLDKKTEHAEFSFDQGRFIEHKVEEEDESDEDENSF